MRSWASAFGRIPGRPIRLASRFPRSLPHGSIETIGRYNAQTHPSTIVIDEERARHWLSKGAQPSDAVRKLLKTQGIA